MLNKKIVVLFLLFFSCNVFSQVKVPDTIYVYEKIIIHDTIYLTKPQSANDLKIALLKLETDSTASIKQTKILKTPTTTDSLNSTSIKNNGKIDYGFSINALQMQYQFTNAENNSTATGLGFGLFLRKNFLMQRFAIQIDANYSYFINNNNADSYQYLFNGYYIKNNTILKFLAAFGKSKQYSFPVKLYYSRFKIKPSIGISYNLNYAAAQFLGTSSSQSFALNEVQNYNIRLTEITYIFGMRYDFTKKISFSINYSQAKNGVIQFKRVDADKREFFVTNTSFNNSQCLLSLQYNFGKPK